MEMNNSRSNQRILEDTIEELRRRKIRITPHRRAILQFLIESKNHPTVEEIHSALEKEYDSVSLATVYNNLRVIVQEGFAQEMKFTDVTSHYEFTGGDEHFHIICTNCGKISDFYLDNRPDVAYEVTKQTGYKVESSRLEVYGLCPECQHLRDKKAIDN